jgi:RNA polymerase sigma-70 factor (ECF subfamily)
MSGESRAECIRGAYTEHRDALYAYAVSLTRNHAAAEDIVQTAVLRLLKRPLLPRNLRAYLFRSVRNLVTDRWRRNADNGEALPELVDENQASLDPLLRDRLWHCLQMLSADERDVILLKTLDGMSFREIAAVRMRSVNTVASWYRRGIERMKELVGRHGI